MVEPSEISFCIYKNPLILPKANSETPEKDEYRNTPIRACIVHAFFVEIYNGASTYTQWNISMANESQVTLDKIKVHFPMLLLGYGSC